MACKEMMEALEKVAADEQKRGHREAYGLLMGFIGLLYAGKGQELTAVIRVMCEENLPKMKAELARQEDGQSPRQLEGRVE